MTKTTGILFPVSDSDASLDFNQNVLICFLHECRP